LSAITMSRRHQRGLSLISLLIALTIGVFLIAGLFDLWLQTRNTFNAQGSLAQLQQNERDALTLMGNVVQDGGFYPLADNYSTTPPSPLFNQKTAFLAGTFGGVDFATAQYISGTGAAAGNSTISVRFVGGVQGGNPTLDCLGQVQPDKALVTNTYQIDANGNLTCAVSSTLNGAVTNTPAQTIVSGISQMVILYGVDPTNTGSATQYMYGSTVTSDNDWAFVKSVKIQLTFKNPLAGQTGQKTTVPAITRIVAVTQTTNPLLS
jgi:type IV pilus assembly protein PilW